MKLIFPYFFYVLVSDSSAALLFLRVNRVLLRGLSQNSRERKHVVPASHLPSVPHLPDTGVASRLAQQEPRMLTAQREADLQDTHNRHRTDSGEPARGWELAS